MAKSSAPTLHFLVHLLILWTCPFLPTTWISTVLSQDCSKFKTTSTVADEEYCKIPWTWNGEERYGCSPPVSNINTGYWCSGSYNFDTDQEVLTCAIQYTDLGMTYCHIPFQYQSVDYYGCIPGQAPGDTTNSETSSWCALVRNLDASPGSWQSCQFWPNLQCTGTTCNSAPTVGYPIDVQGSTVTPTGTGVEPCQFPFKFENVIHNGCITTVTRPRPWCSLTYNYDVDLQWAWCKIVTETGRACDLPFTFKGDTYYECINRNESNSRFWCGTGQEWGHCILTGKHCFLRCADEGKARVHVDDYMNTQGGPICHFPFTLTYFSTQQNQEVSQVYRHCTTFTKESEGLFCGITENVHYQDTFGTTWRYCGDEICQDPGVLPPCAILTESTKNCVFPFHFNGISYTTCTTDTANENVQYDSYWCGLQNEVVTFDAMTTNIQWSVCTTIDYNWCVGPECEFRREFDGFRSRKHSTSISSSATTWENCKAACVTLGETQCKGIEFDYSNNRCYIVTEKGGLDRYQGWSYTDYKCVGQEITPTATIPTTTSLPAEPCTYEAIPDVYLPDLSDDWGIFGSVEDCQAMCTLRGLDNCKAIAWWPDGGPGINGLCVLYTPEYYDWALGGALALLDNSVSFYRRRCGEPKECYARAVRREWFQSLGATLLDLTTTADGCKYLCVLYENSCSVADYNHTSDTCWFHHTLESWINGDPDENDNYREDTKDVIAAELRVDQIRVIRCDCVDTFALYDDQHINGGTHIPGITTEDGCKEYCRSKYDCYSIDYDGGSTEGEVCWVHSVQNSRGDLSPLDGVKHWDRITRCRYVNCTTIMEKDDSNPYLQGGYDYNKLQDNTNCIEFCADNPYCVAVAITTNGACTIYMYDAIEFRPGNNPYDEVYFKTNVCG